MRRVSPIAILLWFLVSMSACGGEGVPSMLEPAGTGAGLIADLWWIIFGLATAVFLLVMGLLAYGLFRKPSERALDSPYAGMFITLSGGVALPSVVIGVLFILTLTTMAALAPDEDSEDLTLHVAGYQFWWEVEYPQHGVLTANEIRIPAGQRVRLEVTAADVIHSFWVPQLQGKIDMIPGRTNLSWIDAAEPGEYRGLCAEFCGVQHALMQFHVIVESQEEFEQWLGHQAEPAAPPETALALEGQAIFMGTACAACHSIQGTDADGDAGPDLTHLMSRNWIAAGVLPNTPENLREFISNPQGVKPGNLMPAMEFSEAEWDALTEYLLTLE